MAAMMSGTFTYLIILALQEPGAPIIIILLQFVFADRLADIYLLLGFY